MQRSNRMSYVSSPSDFFPFILAGKRLINVEVMSTVSDGPEKWPRVIQAWVFNSVMENYRMKGLEGEREVQWWWSIAKSFQYKVLHLRAVTFIVILGSCFNITVTIWLQNHCTDISKYFQTNKRGWKQNKWTGHKYPKWTSKEINTQNKIIINHPYDY